MSLAFLDIFERFETPNQVMMDPANAGRWLSEILQDFTAEGGTVHYGGRSGGKVLVHPRWRYVVKLFNDGPYLQFVRFAFKNPRPSFPKFYDIPRLITPQYMRGLSEEQMYVARMELLLPVSRQEFLDAQFAIYHASDVFTKPNDPNRHPSIALEAKEILERHPNIVQFIQDVQLLNEAPIDGQFDMHQGNVMRRPDGHLVLADPFWVGSTPYADHDRAVQAEIGYDEYEYDEPPRLMGGQRYKKPKPVKYVPPKRDPKEGGSWGSDSIPF